MGYQAFNDNWDAVVPMAERRSHPWLFASLGVCIGLGQITPAQANPELEPWREDCAPPKAIAAMPSAPQITAIKETCEPPSSTPVIAMASSAMAPTFSHTPLRIPAVRSADLPDFPGPTVALSAETLAASAEFTVAKSNDRDRSMTPISVNAEPLPPSNQPSLLADGSPTAPPTEIVPPADSLNADLNIDPQVIEDSPVLQRWLEEVPDVATDIKYDPAFRTRVRVGYATFPSTDHTSGVYVGVQDVFVGRTPLTFSAEYAANGRGDRELLGVDAQYYILPLGWYGNVAPILGYRAIDTPNFTSEGINIGFRIVLMPSRSGAADLSLTQSWVAPGTEDEVGLTTVSVGYAITQDFRIATDIQTQNTPERQESRVSLLMEWML